MPRSQLDIQKFAVIQIERGLTDQEFADLLGISLRQMQRYKSGEAAPHWNAIVGLARKLEIEPRLLIKEGVIV